MQRSQNLARSRVSFRVGVVAFLKRTTMMQKTFEQRRSIGILQDPTSGRSGTLDEDGGPAADEAGHFAHRHLGPPAFGECAVERASYIRGRIEQRTVEIE